MNTSLDITLSFIVGGMLILLLMNLNSRVASETNLGFTETLPIASATQLKADLDYDFPRIGVGLTNIAVYGGIMYASNTRIIFAYDSSRGGILDSCRVEYWDSIPVFNRVTLRFPDGTPIKDSLPNKNEIFVYRRIQNASAVGAVTQRMISYGITQFKLEYFDINGAALVAPMTTTAACMPIRLIKVTFRAESRYRIPKANETVVPDTNAFPYLSICKMYRPRNLL